MQQCRTHSGSAAAKHSGSAAAAVPQNIAAVPQRQCRKTYQTNLYGGSAAPYLKTCFS